MTDDIIERAEIALKRDSVKHHGQLVRELLAALKAERAENERLNRVLDSLNRVLDSLESLQYQAPKAWDGKEPWPGDAVREAWK